MNFFAWNYAGIELDGHMPSWNTNPRVDSPTEWPRGAVMTWEIPAFIGIDMNAEIGSYQEDFGGDYEGV